MIILTGSTRAVAIFALNRKTRGRDVSITRNPSGKPQNVQYVTGPDGVPGSAVYFLGKPNSYIHFPNRGRLDTKDAITLIAWIKMTGRSGPIFHYKYAVILCFF